MNFLLEIRCWATWTMCSHSWNNQMLPEQILREDRCYKTKIKDVTNIFILIYINAQFSFRFFFFFLSLHSVYTCACISWVLVTASMNTKGKWTPNSVYHILTPTGMCYSHNIVLSLVVRAALQLLYVVCCSMSHLRVLFAFDLLEFWKTCRRLRA